MSKNVNFTRLIALAPLLLGIGIKLISVLTLAMGSRILFIILLIVGLGLVLYWVYKKNTKINKVNGILKNRECICIICKHDQTNTCVSQKCPCCIISKENNITGHSDSV